MNIFEALTPELLAVVTGGVGAIGGWVANLVFWRHKIKKANNDSVRDDVKLNDELLMSIKKLQQQVSDLLTELSDRSEIIIELRDKNIKQKDLIEKLQEENKIINQLIAENRQHKKLIDQLQKENRELIGKLKEISKELEKHKK